MSSLRMDDGRIQHVFKQERSIVNKLQQDVVNVLLIEDNPGDARLFQAILGESASNNFEITHVQRLSSALDLLQKSDFEIVLLDLSLPDGQGLDTLRKLQSHTSHLPIVLITGLDDEITAITALREGAQDYLVKGQHLDYQLLVRSMRYAIERKRVDEALRQSEEKAQRLAEENSSLAKIGRIISASSTIEAVFEGFAKEVQKLIPFDRIAISIIDAKNRTYQVLCSIGVKLRGDDIQHTFPLQGSLTEEVVNLKRGVTLQSDDLELAMSRFHHLRSVVEDGLVSFLTLPLISGSETVGVFQLWSSKLNAYTKPHFDLAENIAAQIAGVVANARLYAEVLKTQQALQESERRYRQMIEGANDVVYTADISGYLTYVNHTTCKFTEYSENALTGKQFAFLIDKDWLNRVKRFYYRQYLASSPETILEFPLITKSGETKWLEQSVSLQIDEGEIAGFQAIGRDVTERKHAEEERQSLIVQLQAALAEIKTLGGMLPMCTSCKKIRDDKGYWNQLETYIIEHSDAELSHGICPDCIKILYPDYHERTHGD